jgi:hypothetical protein
MLCVNAMPSAESRPALSPVLPDRHQVYAQDLVDIRAVQAPEEPPQPIR